MSPTPATAVVCDSTSYLPADLIAAREIEVVSLYVSIDGDQSKETEVGDYAAFFDRLRASEGGATTSQPSVGDFAAVYEPLLEAGREVVSVHISAGISGTCEAAQQARQRLIDEGKGGERIASSTRARPPAGWASARSARRSRRNRAPTARRCWPGPKGRARS